MIVTFISECEKNALPRTRRVLDAFANRIGRRTWQTVITAEGLEVVKRALRRAASKNTAVVCHWVRSRQHTELVWVVGNRRKFNAEGLVAVNYTRKNDLLNQPEDLWKSAEIIALAAGIAGLFHDFGKANDLFQAKLRPKKSAKLYEPYRHEWVSMRLFQAFVGDSTDEEWLTGLRMVNTETESRVFIRLHKDQPQVSEVNNAFKQLPPFARLVAWLIVSHHKLPQYPKRGKHPPDLAAIDHYQNELFSPIWNSWNCLDEWDSRTINKNWTFSHATPFVSQTWRKQAKELAERAMRYSFLLRQQDFDNPFTNHLARLVLMVADRFYSAHEKKLKWQDPTYESYANTNENGLNQKLDEHNVGVAFNAYLLARKLPKLKADLPVLGVDKKFTKRTKATRFQWQNRAFDLARSLSQKTETEGFFGINMASTGLGKTLGNARIMYALAGDSGQCRFSVALGLRTLTLQTGDALAKRLKLDETELAVLVGSSAVKRLHKLNNEVATEQDKHYAAIGSESLANLFDDEVHIEYRGALQDGVLSKWLSENPKLEKLLNAPVLVSTIDYLIPATEGVKGGRQIAPMLRLLTSDLVLDEPDDFGLEDLPALCRLVNWAGVLGSRVLLSTATMPPALIFALFSAYQAGRREYTAVNGSLGSHGDVCCAWFDEFSCHSTTVANDQQFGNEHKGFIEARIKKLQTEKQVLRKAALLPLGGISVDNIVRDVAAVIHQGIIKLHNHHHQTHQQGKKISFGLVRVANISPLVAIAKALFNTPSPESYRIHLCVYHGQFPLAMRSHLEQRLDKLLQRDNPEQIWQYSEIQQVLKRSETHHIFVVLATSVAEVGRDHDYDWAIAEPSSMRSLIQLAGRIQRHRKQVPEHENLLILSQNLKALKGVRPAYCRPGFETKKRRFAQHDLAVAALLPQQDYQHISAIPRVRVKGIKTLLNRNDKGEFLNFVKLEHYALYQSLFGIGSEPNYAALWWKNQIDWCGELQKLQPFRQSLSDETFCLYTETDDELCHWVRKDDTSFPVTYPDTEKIKVQSLRTASGKQAWFELNAEAIFDDLAERLEVGRHYANRVFGEINLRKHDDWKYHPVLGVYEDYGHSGAAYLAEYEGVSDE